MQTWAKRGIQTALVTGGLLMLGTGIASADENVSPDRPASPLDGSVTVPVRMDNNALGTPFGQIDGPAVIQTIDVSPTGTLTPVTAACGCGSSESGSTDDAFRGNRAAGDVLVPVDVSGNALALGGDVAVRNEASSQAAVVDRSQVTSADGPASGNVVDLDYALPVQITGNAASGVGQARAESTSTQDASATGDIDTDARGGTLAGNVVAGQTTTPVQITGNAAAALGTAKAWSDASTEGKAGGSIRTDGTGGQGSGNVVALPVAKPLRVDGYAVGAGAGTETRTTNEATATAGSTRTGRSGRQTYVETSGERALGSGSVVQPAAASPVSVNCDAGAVAATADASCLSGSRTIAGGTTQTEGTGSVASGTIATPALAVPIGDTGNALAAVGDATATQDNTVASTAGGDNFTHGSDSAASGTVIAPTTTGPVDILSNSGAGVGTAATDATNDSTTSAGGFSGTSGVESLAGGTMATVPLAVPLEGFGNALSAAGTATSSTTETKTSSSGGASSTDDPGGVGAANLVHGAVSGPVQVMGNGTGVLGDTSSFADADNTVEAGGENWATGTAGTLAGNIGQVATSVPAQVIGSNITAGGVGEAAATSDTTSTAGGNAQTDGTDGLGAGNTVTVPAGSAVQAFGESVAALGESSGDAASTTDTTAGGGTLTSGEGGLGAGNVVAGQAAPLVQSLGVAASGVGGLNKATGENHTTANSGGDIESNGDQGTISGNLLDVPALVAAQPFGDAVGVIGSHSHATADSNTSGAAGGTSTTSGGSGSLSGLDATLPAGVNAPIYDVPVEVLAEAIADATNTSNLTTGEAAPSVILSSLAGPVNRLGATQMPRLPEMLGQSRADSPVPGLDQLGADGLFDDWLGGLLGGGGGLADGLPFGGGVDGVTGGLPGAGGLPVGGGLGGLQVPELPDTGNLAGDLPVRGTADGVPGLAGGFTDGLTSAPGMPQLPGVPGLPGASPATPIGDLLGQTGQLDLDVNKFLPGLIDGVPTSDLPGLAQVPSLPAASPLPKRFGQSVFLSSIMRSAVRQLTARTPALSGLDTLSVLDPSDALESATLADTQSKLEALFASPVG